MTSRSWSLISLAVLAVALLPAARAGDREVQCNPFPNTVQIGAEFLPSGPGGSPPSLPWQIVSDVGGGTFDAVARLAPGFPTVVCAPTAVLQSVGGAANTWNTAALANGTPVTRLALATAPAGTLAAVACDRNPVVSRSLMETVAAPVPGL